MDDKIIMISDQDGNLHDSVQASGVLDISDLKRKEIKQLAKKAAGWSGENGTFSWRDIVSGQADIQGRFTRHEDLFRRKFNKQLEKNIHHTEQQNLLNAAKRGDAEAMGKYVASKTSDVAPIVGGVTVLPAAILAGLGTGVLTGAVQGGKWLFNNPITGTTLDILGTIAGHKNFFSDNGYKKTIARAKEGDVWGAVASGAGDILDFLGPLDLLRRGKQAVDFVQNPVWKYKYKYVDDIGDGGSRWDKINDMDIDHTYQRYVKDGIVNEKKLPNNFSEGIKISQSDLDDYIDVSDGIYSNETKAQWLIDNLKGKSPEEASKFLSEISNPTSPYYNDYISAKRASFLDEYLAKKVSKEAKRKIVSQGRGIEKGLDFAHNTIIARNPLLDPNSDSIVQIMAGIGKRYRRPKWRFDFTKKLTDSYNTDDGRKVIMGFANRNRGSIIQDGIIFPESVAAHEGAHSNPIVNNRNLFKFFYDTDFMNMTDFEKSEFLRRLRPDSPQYQFDYSDIPERHKQLMRPTKSVNDHDIEFAEGYSDAMGTRFNIYNKGISSAALDPTKKYTYLDLIRYKMTPTGMTDRFIRQRGGWWKGWKQQLDALNEVYKNGGKLCQKIK